MKIIMILVLTVMLIRPEHISAQNDTLNNPDRDYLEYQLGNVTIQVKLAKKV